MDEIHPHVILDSLVSHDVLTIKEHQNIAKVERDPNKVKMIIDSILRKDEEVFLYFYHVLLEHYPLLASKVLQAMNSSAVTRGRVTYYCCSFYMSKVNMARFPFLF